LQFTVPSSESTFHIFLFSLSPAHSFVSYSPIYNTTSSSNSTSNSTIIAGSSSLPVPTTVDLALNASIFATTSAPGQGASNAIDGVVNGYKEDGTGDYTKEWASNHEGVGAGLYLSWPTSINVSTVVLYDRPNLSDNILSGKITFSDGTVYQVSAIPNNGSAFVVPINNVATTSLRFTVTAVSSTTSNVGLAEIAVYGSASS
jgi:hypothetical protein